MYKLFEGWGLTYKIYNECSNKQFAWSFYKTCKKSTILYKMLFIAYTIAHPQEKWHNSIFCRKAKRFECFYCNIKLSLHATVSLRKTIKSGDLEDFLSPTPLSPLLQWQMHIERNVMVYRITAVSFSKRTMWDLLLAIKLIDFSSCRILGGELFHRTLQILDVQSNILKTCII